MTNFEHITSSLEVLAKHNIYSVVWHYLDYDYEDNVSEIPMHGFQTSDETIFDDYKSALAHEIEWLNQPVSEEEKQ